MVVSTEKHGCYHANSNQPSCIGNSNALSESYWMVIYYMYQSGVMKIKTCDRSAYTARYFQEDRKCVHEWTAKERVKML